MSYFQSRRNVIPLILGVLGVLTIFLSQFVTQITGTKISHIIYINGYEKKGEEGDYPTKLGIIAYRTIDIKVKTNSPIMNVLVWG